MSNFTFLTEEQCFGNNKLDILKKRGRKAALTDFSILLGAYVSHDHIANNSSLEGRTGFYWTKSEEEYNKVYIINTDGRSNCIFINYYNCGARPALPFSEVSSIPTNGKMGERAKVGILEVEYG